MSKVMEFYKGVKVRTNGKSCVGITTGKRNKIWKRKGNKKGRKAVTI